MKLLIASDLHLDFPSPCCVLDNLTIPDHDVAVIAGDVAESHKVFGFLDHLCTKFNHVVYTPGNHDYYRSSITQMNGMFSFRDWPKNFTLLQNSSAEVMGQRFIGGTLWHKAPKDPSMHYRMNDIRQIRDFATEYQRENIRFPRADILPTDVVVSHHLPSYESVCYQYQGSPTNCFFVSPEDLTIKLKQPKLWVHGHTHTPCDYKLWDTRVVCNPMGYPNESYGFKFRVIDV